MLQRSTQDKFILTKLVVFLSLPAKEKKIMVLYEYDGNAILAEPIKNRTSAELLRSFQVMETKLTARGLQPKLMRLDNEASQLLKSYLHDKNITFQVVTP
jgi:hypothetical protein